MKIKQLEKLEELLQKFYEEEELSERETTFVEVILNVISDILRHKQFEKDAEEVAEGLKVSENDGSGSLRAKKG